MEFKAFPKIEQFGKLNMFITQKIHGTNAQVYIKEVQTVGFAEDLEFEAMIHSKCNYLLEVEDKAYALYVGSRNKWITPEDDNAGFASFVYENAEAFIRCLGPGQHFGEWVGPKINSGEGLSQKVFVLFDHWKYPPERELPPQTTVVPVLYQGKTDLSAVESVMEDLRINGSKLAPGYMNPEGVVVTIGGVRYKKVFKPEETGWKSARSVEKKQVEKSIDGVDINSLLQPIRLEKLLSRDSQYVENFPNTLGQICNDYIQDLLAEDQIRGTEEQKEVIVKAVKKKLFYFVKEMVENVN